MRQCGFSAQEEESAEKCDHSDEDIEGDFDSGEDESWRQLGLERFAAAYCEEDSVYEKLIDGPGAR